MRPRCFLVSDLAPDRLSAAQANARLNDYAAELEHGLPVFHDHFARQPHGGIAVVFPRDERERARLDDPGALAISQLSVMPLVYSLTPVGFTAQTHFTLERYGRTSLEQLRRDEDPDPRFWWQTRRD